MTKTITEPTELRAPRTFTQMLAAVLRHISDNLDGGPQKAPTIEELSSAQLYDARVALLAAEAEEERLRFTVGMLRERVKRLAA